MTYSIIGILAAIGVLGYYITDLLWGIFDSYHLTTILYIDTFIHFIMMVGAVVLWTQYVTVYLDEKSLIAKILRITGYVFFVLVVLSLVVNLFVPIFFWIDDEANYHAGMARHITLGVQIFMFVTTSIYTLIVVIKSKGTKKRRYGTIGLFGLAMTTFIVIQIFYPLLQIGRASCRERV